MQLEVVSQYQVARVLTKYFETRLHRDQRNHRVAIDARGVQRGERGIPLGQSRMR